MTFKSFILAPAVQFQDNCGSRAQKFAHAWLTGMTAGKNQPKEKEQGLCIIFVVHSDVRERCDRS